MQCLFLSLSGRFSEIGLFWGFCIFKRIYFFKFLFEYNVVFLLYNKVNQLCIYIYPLLFFLISL